MCYKSVVQHHEVGLIDEVQLAILHNLTCHFERYLRNFVQAHAFLDGAKCLNVYLFFFWVFGVVVGSVGAVNSVCTMLIGGILANQR